MPGSMSGVTVDDDIKKVIEELMKKKHQFAVFKLGVDEQNKNAWQEVARGARLPGCEGHGTTDEATLRGEWDKFVEEYLNPDQAVFGLYDFSVVPALSANVVCVQWCPDTLGVKIKMKFASSVDPLKKIAESSSKVFIKNDPEDVTFDEIKKEYGCKV